MLQIQQVTKTYEKRTAIDQLDLSVAKGSCFGLLGPNGAGKSTLMKLITGIIQPDKGSIVVMGLDVRQHLSQIQRQIGYVPQSITLYEELTAIENLRFFGKLAGVKGQLLQTRIDDVLAKTGLADRGKDAVLTFSGGMKRRINIAAALLHQPKLLILDEPTVGIDPQSRNLIFELIRELNQQGLTILYSTHYMEEVEALCDEIAIIDHGEVIAKGKLTELLATYTTPEVYVEAPELLQAPIIADYNIRAKGNGWVIETDQALHVMQKLIEKATAEKWTVNKLEISYPSLEDVFLTLTGTTLRDA